LLERLALGESISLHPFLSSGNADFSRPQIILWGRLRTNRLLIHVGLCSVRLTTTLSNTLEGTLFVADPITNLIAINTAPPPPTPSSNNANSAAQPGDYHIIPVNQISSFKILFLSDSSGSKESSFETALPKISNVNLAATKQREEAAVRRLQENERRLGKGVTREGQEIFDALSKT